MPQVVDPNKKKKKGKPPAHQNTYAFKHNPKSKKTASILASPIEHCCQRCIDKIEWRKKYRKYKPLTQPSTCNICHNRNISSAYHTVCDTCSRKSTKAITFLHALNNPDSNGKESKAPSSCVSDMNEVKDDGENSQSAVEADNQSCDDDAGVDHVAYRRVCTICFKAPAVPASDDESSGDDEEVNIRRLRLREIKSLQRLKERAITEKRQQRRQKQQNGQSNGQDQSDSEDEDDDEADRDEDQHSEDKLLLKLKVTEDDDDDANDPFLIAVGGKDRLVTGEAYQQLILSQQSKQEPPTV
jgi:Uncharacterized conserved protein (DUF2039)